MLTADSLYHLMDSQFKIDEGSRDFHLHFSQKSPPEKFKTEQKSTEWGYFLSGDEQKKKSPCEKIIILSLWTARIYAIHIKQTNQNFQQKVNSHAEQVRKCSIVINQERRQTILVRLSLNESGHQCQYKQINQINQTKNKKRLEWVFDFKGIL